MSILLENKLLQAAEKKIESGLTPQNREDYTKIVVAGMKTGLAKGPEGILASLKQSKDPVQDCAVGAINIVMLLREQSRGTMPAKALVPAAMTLMLQALDFMDKARIKRVGVKDLERATRIFTNYIFTVFKITPQMLKGMGIKVRGIVQDPTQMDMIARKAGVVKDPRASQPTDMPADTGPTPKLPAYRPGLINAARGGDGA
jgi:hypothetical protein